MDHFLGKLHLIFPSAHSRSLILLFLLSLILGCCCFFPKKKKKKCYEALCVAGAHFYKAKLNFLWGPCTSAACAAEMGGGTPKNHKTSRTESWEVVP